MPGESRCPTDASRLVLLRRRRRLRRPLLVHLVREEQDPSRDFFQIHLEVPDRDQRILRDSPHLVLEDGGSLEETAQTTLEELRCSQDEILLLPSAHAAFFHATPRMLVVIARSERSVRESNPTIE